MGEESVIRFLKPVRKWFSRRKEDRKAVGLKVVQHILFQKPIL